MKLKAVLHVGVDLVWDAGWAPISVFLLHVFISRVLNGYILYPPLDLPMHFFGGVAMAYFLSRCFAALPESVVAPQFRQVAQFIVVMSLTTTASVFWEFAEFISDAALGTHAQLGLEDTLSDMVLGILGGLAFLVLAVQRRTLGRVVPVVARES